MLKNLWQGCYVIWFKQVLNLKYIFFILNMKMRSDILDKAIKRLTLKEKI